MMHVRTHRSALVIPALVLALVFSVAVVGCSSKPAEKTTTAATATGDSANTAYSMATSMLSTTAPDAKLLIIQTQAAVTTTVSPAWVYLFGSPKNDKTYLVAVADGKAEPATEYGVAGLGKDEWKKVQGVEGIKIDSDKAYETARAACSAEATAAYTMGLVTYIPSAEESSATKPYVWYVSFDPASSATTTGVQVDAQTGKVLAK